MRPEFYDRPVVDVACELIGCLLVAGECRGVIVETEAYHDSEPACHGYVGLRPRTRTLFGEPGRAYVYRSYGIHVMFNAVCERPGVGAAVLIRALEPVAGLALMRARRGLRTPPGSASRERDLCSGPGKLTQALGLDLDADGRSLLHGPAAILPRLQGAGMPEVRCGPRIGITKATELPWRFCAAGSRFLSAPLPRAGG